MLIHGNDRFQNDSSDTTYDTPTLGRKNVWTFSPKPEFLSMRAPSCRNSRLAYASCHWPNQPTDRLGVMNCPPCRVAADEMA